MTPSGRALRIVDSVTILATAVAGVLAVFDLAVPTRTLWACVLVLFSPGWAFLRLRRAVPELFTYVLAVALSMSFTMLMTLVLTTRLGWAWQAAAGVTALACIAALSFAIWRVPNPPAPPVDDSPRDVADGDVVDRRRGGPLARVLFGVVGLAVAIAGIAATDAAEIGPWGIFDAVPRWYYAGTTLIVIGLIANLVSHGRRRIALAWAHLVALVFAIHGVPAIAEPHPRFPVAWLHVAFADHIAGGGRLLQTADARFSWPGFFSGAAYLERLSGTDTMLWALAFAPVVVNCASAALVYELGRTLGLSQARSTVAALVLVLTNWIGQDYFAPQAAAFLLVLTVIDLTLRNRSLRPPGGFRARLLRSRVPTTRPYSLGPIDTLVVIVVLAAALIVSHQLSPVMLLCILAGMVIAHRAGSFQVVVIVALGFAGWLSYAAEAYWIGHADIIFGSVGDVSGAVSQNVTERSRPGADIRQTIVRMRMLTVLLVWLCAGAHVLIQRVRRRLDPAVAILLAGPFVPFVLQPYGGEGLLRTALFSLPGAALAAAQLLPAMPSGSAVRRLGAVAGALAATIAVPTLLITRYGNESYEQITDDDLAMYSITRDELDHARSEGRRFRLLSAEQPSPMLIGRMEYYTSSLRLPRRTERAAEVVTDLLQGDIDVVYLLVTASNVAQRAQVYGLPDDWPSEYFGELGEQVELRLVSSAADGLLFAAERIPG